MATNLRRFTISVIPPMDDALDKAKKERYYKVTQNEMIWDLIIQGLRTLDLEASDTQGPSPE